MMVLALRFSAAVGSWYFRVAHGIDAKCGFILLCFSFGVKYMPNYCLDRLEYKLPEV